LEIFDYLLKIKMQQDNSPGDRNIDIDQRASKIRKTALLPTISMDRYEEAWAKFVRWKSEHAGEVEIPTENMLLVYFDHLSKTLAASSLWTTFSMVKKQMQVSFFIFIFILISIFAFLLLIILIC
jgi:hypothetical protein